MRYAPTDSLLKALILANVPRAWTTGNSWHCYMPDTASFWGEREASQVLDPDEFDEKAFQANSARLERRLRTLGMLRRLSDACAYVENPLARIVR